MQIPKKLGNTFQSLALHQILSMNPRLFFGKSNTKIQLLSLLVAIKERNPPFLPWQGSNSLFLQPAN